ncbi:peptidase [Pseudoxanthomonas kalamensis DSM 18571]|nr:peptidase [Pseudoxanthomonas kalamensis DSM 18571]
MPLPLLATGISPPKSVFGFNIGDDYQLTNYTDTVKFFENITSESDRLKLVDIGPTSEGRRQYMVIASSPENLKNLEKYRQISEKLARAEGVSEEQAKMLAKEGKAIVWIDGGLHSTETVGTHQLIETIYQIASRNDEEMRYFLDNTIVLLVHANPDGHELVSNWYMREPVKEKRVLDPIPTLYHYWAGHDNNRDAYMNSLDETTNMSKVLYLQWFPQIMYNHHQTSPTGTVIAIPPWRNPVNYNINPGIVNDLEKTGAAIMGRYIAEGKGGAIARNGHFYSAWWNGGQRTTPYFHNMIGLLTEIWGNPTPTEIGFVPDKQVPSTDLPLPIRPQKWHFRQSIDYSLTANWAVLDFASKNKDELLLGIWRMGQESISKGSKDTWTFNPNRMDTFKAMMADRNRTASGADSAMTRYRAKPLTIEEYDQVEEPDQRDPRAYVIPSDQADFNTAKKFLNALIKSGVGVEVADATFSLNGKSYPAGSYIVRTAQSFRPHILDMFEPQNHPNDFEYPGGPPIAPYDSAGWTLAYQMGVKFDRVLDGFTAKTHRLPYGELQVAEPGKVIGSGACYVFSPKMNDSFLLANKLLAAGATVSRLTSTSSGLDAGSFVVPATKADSIADLAASTGVDVRGMDCPSPTIAVKAPRIALVDKYGGSMPSGWNRKILEEFGFEYTVLFPQQIDAGKLRSKFDVVLMPSDIKLPLPGAGDGKSESFSWGPPVDESRVPVKFRDRLGEMTEKSADSLKQFMEQGGTVIAEGSSTNLAYYLDIGLSDYLVKNVDGKKEALKNTEIYIPGSILKATVASNAPATWGLGEEVDLYYADGKMSRSPVFKINSNSPANALLKFNTNKPLRSGWAWGQQYLENGVIGAQAPVGKGQVYLFSTDITFRTQMHGGYKLLFNSLYDIETQ